MNFKIKKDKLLKQKKIYIFLIVLIILGMFIGALFPLFLDKENMSILNTSVTTFFNNIKNNNINYNDGLINSILSNGLMTIGIWLLGISIIGIPIILFILIYKGFLLAFSFSSIIKVYGFKGILGSITYIFPGGILELIVITLLSFYSISFSVKLFKYLFLKENFNFKLIMNKYIKILLISLLSYLVISLIDVYLAPLIMKLFTIFLN